MPPVRRCQARRGGRLAANSEQRTANSEKRTANSEQRTANSEQRRAQGGRRPLPGNFGFRRNFPPLPDAGRGTWGAAPVGGEALIRRPPCVFSSRQRRVQDVSATRVRHGVFSPLPASGRGAATPGVAGGEVRRERRLSNCNFAIGSGSEQREANGEQRTANSEQRTANSERRTANGEQRTANSEQFAAAGAGGPQTSPRKSRLPPEFPAPPRRREGHVGRRTGRRRSADKKASCVFSPRRRRVRGPCSASSHSGSANSSARSSLCRGGAGRSRLQRDRPGRGPDGTPIIELQYCNRREQRTANSSQRRAQRGRRPLPGNFGFRRNFLPLPDTGRGT
jgi:hypothetical protein